MSRFLEGVVLVALFVMRLGIPITLTLIVGFVLRLLDKKWEADALNMRSLSSGAATLAARVSAPLPCWLVKGCPADQIADCPAHANKDLPCWLARLRAEGRIPQMCAGCELFRTPTAGAA